MKINLAKSAGFCFGTRRALEIALKTARSAKNVYLLGDIVHNEDVVREIKKKGIKKIRALQCGRNKTLLIRAHGAGLRTINRAQVLGYKIIDATCPMVKEIHKIASGMERKGYKIIVIGDRKHDEVRGITGQLNKEALIIDPSKDTFKKINGIKKAAVVVQSTQNLNKAIKIVAALKNNIPELKFFNTICMPTRIKQKEINTMPKENDVMIIIGSKTSANTRRLYEISKALNKNSYWIKSSREINPRWFKAADSVGVTAGASTPNSTTNEVIKYITRLT